ncbi:MAG: hypothetical protein JSS20_15845, partial [Proteobacteria bacterium]|nr:hypothetical protein [Pseudomonadota bacterium]
INRSKGLKDVRGRLAEIPGVVPSLKGRIKGCLFAPRCSFATDHCRQSAPALQMKAPNHAAACWMAPVDEKVPA